MPEEKQEEKQKSKREEKIEQKAEEILKYDNLWYRITVEELGKKIVEEVPARRAVLICCVGRLVNNAHPSSYNLIVHSESSAGKDHVVKSVLDLMPKDDIFYRTRITKTVLNYKMPPKGTWDGMILYIPDISEDLLNSDAVKVMGSEGSYITVTEKTKDGMAARDIYIPGKPAMITTSANAVPNDEVLNRFSVVKLNESKEQTQKIYEHMADLAVNGKENEFDEHVLKAMELLGRRKVRVSYAKKIAQVFPYEKLSGRRGFNRFIDFIKASAILHQRQRDWVDEETIDANLKDYDIAREVFGAINAGTSCIPLGRRDREIVRILKKAKNEGPLSSSQIHQRLKVSLALKNMRNHLDSLSNLKILHKKLETNWAGREVETFELSDEYWSYTDIDLPKSEDL